MATPLARKPQNCDLASTLTRSSGLTLTSSSKMDSTSVTATLELTKDYLLSKECRRLCSEFWRLRRSVRGRSERSAPSDAPPEPRELAGLSINFLADDIVLSYFEDGGHAGAIHFAAG